MRDFTGGGERAPFSCNFQHGVNCQTGPVPSSPLLLVTDGLVIVNHCQAELTHCDPQRTVITIESRFLALVCEPESPVTTDSKIPLKMCGLSVNCSL